MAWLIGLSAKDIKARELMMAKYLANVDEIIIDISNVFLGTQSPNASLKIANRIDPTNLDFLAENSHPSSRDRESNRWMIESLMDSAKSFAPDTPNLVQQLGEACHRFRSCESGNRRQYEEELFRFVKKIAEPFARTMEALAHKHDHAPIFSHDGLGPTVVGGRALISFVEDLRASQTVEPKPEGHTPLRGSNSGPQRVRSFCRNHLSSGGVGEIGL